MPRPLKFIFFLVLIIICASCNEIRVSTNKSVPPTFHISAGMAECCTKFTTVKVFEDYATNKQPVWEVNSNLEIDAEDSPRDITYGVTPAGFAQIVPKTGAAPSLVEGREYLVIAGAPNYVPWARTCFVVKDVKIVEHECPKD